MRNINNSLLYQLNPEEQKQCLEVINNMIASGFCTYEKDTLECLRLTDKGYEGLYPKKSLEELEEVILDIFRRTNSNVGEGFMERQLRNLERDLNPEDAKTLIEAANSLIHNTQALLPKVFWLLIQYLIMCVMENWRINILNSLAL